MRKAYCRLVHISLIIDKQNYLKVVDKFADILQSMA